MCVRACACACVCVCVCVKILIIDFLIFKVGNIQHSIAAHMILTIVKIL